MIYTWHFLRSADMGHMAGALWFRNVPENDLFSLVVRGVERDSQHRSTAIGVPPSACLCGQDSCLGCNVDMHTGSPGGRNLNHALTSDQALTLDAFAASANDATESNQQALTSDAFATSAPPTNPASTLYVTDAIALGDRSVVMRGDSLLVNLSRNGRHQ